jgi:anti-anti-sigma regulatory factor
MDGADPQRTFRLLEVESWPECREVIVEGGVDRERVGEFDACLLRALEAHHDYLLIDFDRCESIDVMAVKQLVVARQRFSDQQRELLVFGAAGEVRSILERVGAFDCRPAPPSPLRSPALSRLRLDRRSRSTVG